MQWVSVVSEEERLQQAVADAIRQVELGLGGAEPDLVVIFITSHYERDFYRVSDLIMGHWKNTVLLGCSSGGVIGSGKEVEGRAAVSLTAAVLPDVKVTPIRLERNLLPSESSSASDWERVLNVKVEQDPHFILLPDPYSFDAESFLKSLDGIFPQSSKVGGLASGGEGVGSSTLFMDYGIFRNGLVGVALSGNIAVDTLIAHGCRAIGMPLFVTRSQGHIIEEIDGVSPLAVLRQIYSELDDGDRNLFANSLSLGLAVNGSKKNITNQDFLIRNIIGMDMESEALVVGTDVEEHSVIQFHLRDAATSDADLKLVLSRYLDKVGAIRPAGSLLFSCMGRGKELYGHSDHDTEALKQYFGTMPLGGFFCNGEIGPLNGLTFLHGYTSSIGLFREQTNKKV